MRLKKIIVLVISMVVLFSCVSCAAKSNSANSDAAPITSEWTYDHAVNKGNLVSRTSTDRDEDLPHFSSDGKTFSFNIVSGKTYTGTVEANDDGTYTLRNGSGKGDPITVTIEGDSLTVHISDNTSVTFVTK